MNPYAPTPPPTRLDTWLASLDHVQIGIALIVVGALMLLPGLVSTVYTNLPRNQEPRSNPVNSDRKAPRSAVRR